MSNFNPNPVDPDRNKISRDVAQDNQILRDQNIAMQAQNRAIRENDGAATGLIFGILLLGLAALGFGFYFFTQRPTPAPTRTIIERNKTTIVPAKPVSPPNVNVTIPNPAPPNVNVTIPEPAAPPVAPPAAQPVAPAPAPAQAPAPSNASPQAAPANP